MGINHLDTAYMYGRAGESERLIARALGRPTRQMVIATKCGLHWDPEGRQTHDARPATLRRQCEESLRRLATDRVELLYLHAPDKNVPVAESAGELRRLLDEGKTRAVGARTLGGSIRSVRRRVPVGRLPAALQHAHAADRGTTCSPGAASTMWPCWSTGR